MVFEVNLKKVLSGYLKGTSTFLVPDPKIAVKMSYPYYTFLVGCCKENVIFCSLFMFLAHNLSLQQVLLFMDTKLLVRVGTKRKSKPQWRPQFLGIQSI